MVTEFCPGGNLKKFLIKSRISDNPNTATPHYVNVTSTSDYVNITSTLSHRHLLKIAADVASGMAHLSSQNVIEFIGREYFHHIELFHFLFNIA